DGGQIRYYYREYRISHQEIARMPHGHDTNPGDTSKTMGRRSFIKTAGAAGAAAATTGIAKNIFPATVLGANERILTGHIGLGGMGKRDLQFTLMQDDLQPIAMCDLLEQHREQGADITLNKFPDNRPTTHEYHEEIL